MKRIAVFGGKPVRDNYLAYGRQTIDEEDIQSVVNVLKGDYLTTGPYVKEFEEKVASHVGAKYDVAVSSGTAALHMACFAAGIKEGDEVIVSPITFAASANAVLYCGGTPVFVDIDPLTYNIDPEKIEEKITNKTKAIIPVDFSGQSVDVDKIKAIADRHDLIIIEDAAHALGSEYKGRKVGSLADVQSALGTSQIDKFIKRRREVVKQYNEAFKNIKGIVTPYEADFSNSGWHIYVIKIKPEFLKVTRKEIFEALQAENIGVNVHYLPVYLNPYYRGLGYEKGLCPNSEDLYDNMITLPLFPSMTNEDVEDVITAVNKVIDYFRK